MQVLQFPSINGVVVTWVVAIRSSRATSTRRGFDSPLMHPELPRNFFFFPFVRTSSKSTVNVHSIGAHYRRPYRASAPSRRPRSFHPYLPSKGHAAHPAATVTHHSPPLPLTTHFPPRPRSDCFQPLHYYLGVVQYSIRNVVCGGR